MTDIFAVEMPTRTAGLAVRAEDTVNVFQPVVAAAFEGGESVVGRVKAKSRALPAIFTG